MSRLKETELPQLQEMKINLDADAWHDAPDEVIDKLRSSQWELLTIDATDAKPPGAQVAQLLLSAQKTSVEANRELRILHASDTFKSGLQALGLFEALEGSII